VANKKRGGLGRGLNALINSTDITEEETGSKTGEEGFSSDKESKKSIDELPLELLVPNPDQPRKRFKKEELKELASSIKRDGLLQPILVRKMDDGTYQIIAGERRWQACKSIGLETVPVRIKETTDEKVTELALIENIQRSDLNPIEEALGYRSVMEEQNLTQSQLAEMMSKGRSTIANALRLLDLPQEAQKLLVEEKITAGHARAILSVSSEEGRQKLVEKLVEGKLSVRETENLARLIENRPDPSNSKRVATPNSYKVAAKSLRKKFSTKVRVKSVRGKNKIEIEFKDEDDLRRIVEAMTNGSEKSES
jgi:ParB family transcriptional regulator, chromosome partitioning protein